MQKNNYSNEHLMYLKKIKRQKRLIWICQAALLIFFFGIWELLAQLGVIDAFIVSSPSRAAATFVNLLREGSLWLHVGTTLWETLIGFSVGTVLGVLIAIMLWYSDFARRVFDPYLVVLNALPENRFRANYYRMGWRRNGRNRYNYTADLVGRYNYRRN